jgi:hypothetical protein
MKKSQLLSLLIMLILFQYCSKDEKSEKFKLLTGHVWTTDSLLVNGIDASDPGEQLYKFKGDARFKEDGTGQFGKFPGTWRFAFDETQLVIDSDSLPFPLSTVLRELNATSLKITTNYPTNPPIYVRMTFKPK